MRREDRIVFDESTHTYFVDGAKVPLSVTGVIHRYAREFDAHEALRRMAPEKKGGSSDEDILQMWKRNGEVARARGQLMHAQIESLLNGVEIEGPLSPELAQFMAIAGDLGSVYRTEVRVYSATLNVAGQVDALFSDGDRLVVVDWKRSKDITTTSRRQMKQPLDHLPDVNYWRALPKQT